MTACEVLALAAPRPWRIERYGDGDSLVIHDARSEWRVCFMATPGFTPGGGMDRIEANAELIVQAVNGWSKIMSLVTTSEPLEVDGTAESLAITARMIETWGPQALPANADGKLHFARIMLDCAAAEIRAFLARHLSAD